MVNRLVLTVLPLALTVLPVAFTPPSDLAIPAVSPFTPPLFPASGLQQAFANSSAPFGLHQFTFVHATSSVASAIPEPATLLTLCA